MSVRKLNLGCGRRFHPAWTNVDFTATGAGVISADLNRGIPFPDESFDVVYHSHLLEHIVQDKAADFILECYRVLRFDGVIRVVVPDLEAIVRNYLVALEHARSGRDGWDKNYDWVMLEMYDQVVRNRSGGEMARYLAHTSLPNEAFVVGRCGAEVRSIIAEAKERAGKPSAVVQQHAPQASNLTTAEAMLNRAMGLYWMLRKPADGKKRLLQWLLGNEYKALQVGRFRLGGEIHQWMYDSYSLGRLLMACGFRSVVIRSATESYITAWSSYNLDTEPDGSVYKPDSVFIEALK